MGWSLPVACLAFVAFFAGCTDDDTTKGPDGHFVYYNWGMSQSSCTNGVCTYGKNHVMDDIVLKCTVPPTLSWDSNNWIHGSVTAVVVDDDGIEAASMTVSTSTKGSLVVQGEPDDWNLRTETRDANGNLQFRLTCGP